jgi:uncharacterized protein (TIGR02145 family)
VETAYGSEVSFTTAAASQGVPCPGVPTLTDIDGNTYNTVQIGSQCWTKENLRVTKYNDGTSIPLDNSGGSTGNDDDDDVRTWSGQTTGAYTIFGNESSTGTNATNYGFLYNWYAAGIIANGGSPTKNICPTGWHVPTDEEWTTLTTFLGGESVAGGKMKSTVTQPTTGGWNTPNISATNESGFSALPGGYRYGENAGNFKGIRNIAVFWSATEYDSGYDLYGWARVLGRNAGSVGPSFEGKQNGNSVRCLKD